MSQRLQNLVEHAGYKVTREHEEINVYNPSDEDEYPDLIELVSKFSDVSIFEQVVGPPSLEVSHTVFAYNDDDYAKFNGTL